MSEKTFIITSSQKSIFEVSPKAYTKYLFIYLFIFFFILTGLRRVKQGNTDLLVFVPQTLLERMILFIGSSKTTVSLKSLIIMIVIIYYHFLQDNQVNIYKWMFLQWVYSCSTSYIINILDKTWALGLSRTFFEIPRRFELSTSWQK